MLPRKGKTDVRRLGAEERRARWAADRDGRVEARELGALVDEAALDGGHGGDAVLAGVLVVGDDLRAKGGRWSARVVRSDGAL